MKLLTIASKIGIVYFTIFSIFYISRFVYAYRVFAQYHSTITGIDFGYTMIRGSVVFNGTDIDGQGLIIFKVLAILAVLGAGVWFYQFKWGE